MKEEILRRFRVKDILNMALVIFYNDKLTVENSFVKYLHNNKRVTIYKSDVTIKQFSDYVGLVDSRVTRDIDTETITFMYNKLLSRLIYSDIKFSDLVYNVEKSVELTLDILKVLHNKVDIDISDINTIVRDIITYIPEEYNGTDVDKVPLDSVYVDLYYKFANKEF